MTKNYFRFFILSMWVFGILGILVTVSVPEIRESVILASLQKEQSKFTLQFTAVIAICITLLGIVSSIGLFLFKYWAYRLYWYFSIIGVLVEYFSAPMVMTGIGHMFIMLSYISQGIVLGVLLSTEGHRWFKNSNV